MTKNQIRPSLYLEENQTLLKPSKAPSHEVVLSIKFCLITLLSSLVVLTVFVLTVAWLSGFVPTLLELSSSAREKQFQLIVDYSNKILEEVAIGNQELKQQFFTDDYNFSFSSIMKKTYATYKASQKYLPGVTVSAFVGDPFNNAQSTISFGDVLAQINNSNALGSVIYFCGNYTLYDQCNRSSVPDKIVSAFDNSFLIKQCESNPNHQFYTSSYVSQNVQFTFITIVNCAVIPSLSLTPGHNFHYFIGNDLTIDTISKFLLKSVQSIYGSRSFIIETQTSYVIAVDNDSSQLTEWKADGSFDRKTSENIADPTIVSLSKIVLATHKSWNQIPCNTYFSMSDTTQYISIYRLCTSTRIDWIIALSEPKWNTIRSTIISIICSLIGSICVILLGIILGVIVSLRLVKPFNHLIQLFDSVAHMDLESISLYGTIFLEVKILQRQFLSMVEKIKLYKSFIPRHLLAELESTSSEENSQQNKDTTSMLDSSTHPSSSNAAHSTRTGVGFRRYSNDHPNKFALHLEIKSSSFVQVHLGGIGQLLNQSIPPDEIVKLLSDVYHQLHAVSRHHGGVVSSNFDNECVTISFNASTSQANHPLKALTTSSVLRQKLAQVKSTKWNTLVFHELLNHVEFRFGVHSQQSYCGNIGTNEIKNYSIISSAQRNLEQLIRVAHRLCVDIVFSEALLKEALHGYQARYIDTVSKYDDFTLSTLYETDHSRAPFDPHKGMKVYELGLSNKVNEDEWMYELQEKNKKSQWRDYNDACALLFEYKYGDAASQFKAFSNEYPLDEPSKYLYQQCIR